METERVAFAYTWQSANAVLESKGAPGLESRTGRRLVSPATGGEKKKWNPLYFGLKMQIRLHLGHLRVLVGQYSAILHEKLLWGLIEAKKIKLRRMITSSGQYSGSQLHTTSVSL